MSKSKLKINRYYVRKNINFKAQLLPLTMAHIFDNIYLRKEYIYVSAEDGAYFDFSGLQMPEIRVVWSIVNDVNSSFFSMTHMQMCVTFAV